MSYISVIIPAFNTSKYIEETLRSLFQQTDKNFEVVVVDDCSTDDTVTIAADCLTKYNLKGIVLKRPTHITKGVSACRNFGVANAKGDWISFLDSDDLFCPEKIYKTYEKIHLYGKDCSVFENASLYFDDETRATLFTKTKEGFKEPQYYIDGLLADLSTTTCSITINKSFFLILGGFDETLVNYEDFHLWLRASKKVKWYYFNEMLTEIRVRKQSSSNGRNMEYYISNTHKLIVSLKKTKQFTKDEIAQLYKSVLEAPINYYASTSINRYGWGDFLKGLWLLFKIGDKKLAIGTFFRHFKFLILKKVAAVLKAKK